MFESNESENNSVVTDDTIGNDDYNSLVNSTNVNNINPGDIRQLTPTPSKGNYAPFVN